MTKTPVVHRAGPDDWERVRAVRLRALADSPNAFWVTVTEELERSAEQWRERLGASVAATFLATLDGTDVGLVVIHPSDVSPPDAGLAAMWVAPEARGRGVADALITTGVRWARERGYPRVRLWINDTNVAAARLYARHGFTPTGTTGTFPPPRDHIPEHERALEL